MVVVHDVKKILLLDFGTFENHTTIVARGNDKWCEEFTIFSMTWVEHPTKVAPSRSDLTRKERFKRYELQIMQKQRN